jgi:hypothetical protein
MNSTTNDPEYCPLCGESSGVRPKMVLIDQVWVPTAGKDARLAYLADLRVDDLNGEVVLPAPLEQFIDGFYCDRCKRAFVPDGILNENHRRYR